MLLAATAIAGLAMNTISGALDAAAKRESARAEMAALTQSWQFNKGVLQQNKIDTYASNILQSWGSGINYATGSTAAVIQNNQRVLQNAIDFQESQYQTQMANLRAQSKQRFLGIF